MLTLKFQGWFQCRLATDPDPADEPRGVSGSTRCLAGEPDFDRIIRFHQPVHPRTHTPEVGVFVTKVILDNTIDESHPLLGAAFNLEGNPTFYGFNGIIGDDGNEPIVPFIVSVKKGTYYLERRIGIGNTPFPKTMPINGTPGGVDVYELTGIWNPEKAMDERIRRLETDRSRTADIEAFNIAERIKFLTEVRERNGRIGRVAVEKFSGKESWLLKLEGAILQEGGRVVRTDESIPWLISFWMGGWDSDALCGYTNGILQIP